MSTPTNDGGPAFPQVLTFGPTGLPETAAGYFENSGGMSLRDYFAAHATEKDIEAHTIYGTRHSDGGSYAKTNREAAKFAYADAMLAARNQTTT